MEKDAAIYCTWNKDYVDIHGRSLKVTVSDDNKIFIPLDEVKKTGFHIFRKEAYKRSLVGKSMILNEFRQYMLGAAREFMIENAIHSLNSDDILETIEICRQQLLKDDEGVDPVPSKATGILGRTLLTNPIEVNKEVRSVIEQNLQHPSSSGVFKRLADSGSAQHRNWERKENYNRPYNNGVNHNESGDSLRPPRSNSRDAPIRGSSSILDDQKVYDRQKPSGNSQWNNRPDSRNGFNKNKENSIQQQNRNSNFNTYRDPKSRNSLNFAPNAKVAAMRENSRSGSDTETPEYIRLSDCNVKRIELQRSTQQVKVVHVEPTHDKLKYWVNLVENENTILEIITECIEHADSAVAVNKPKLGEICMALSKDDDVWYRAVVLRAHPVIKIHFIDFGNDAVVSDLRVLPKSLQTIPAQAVRITFDGSAPSHELVVDQVLSVRFMKGYPDGTNLVSWETNTGKPNRASQPAKEAGCPDIAFMDQIKYSTAVRDAELVKIIAYSDGKFYLRNKEHHDKLLDITANIKDLRRELVTGIKLGQVVLCKKDDEEHLCRALVRKIDDGVVIVNFIDFNTQDNVSLKVLYGISKTVANLPVALIESPVIKGYDPKMFGEKAKLLIQDLIISKAKCHVVMNGTEFDLNIKGESLSKKLFPEAIKLAEPDLKLQSTSVISTPKLEPVVSIKTEPIVEEVRQPVPTREKTPEVPATKYTKVFYQDMPAYQAALGKADYMVTECKNPFAFTATATGDEDMDLLSKCSDIDIVDDEPYEPEEQEVILAKHEGGWYRGAIIEALETGKFVILFVEYGNVAALTKADIRKLPQEFRKIPMMGITCQIDIPATEPVKKRLGELIESEQTYEMNIISYDAENVLYMVEIPKVKDILVRERLL